MLQAGDTAQASSYKVGYRSPSQFSREYNRMFGESPLRHMMRLKQRGDPARRIADL
jgi:AraC-like DNA-binding protein